MDRSDWLRERRDPAKADGAWSLCHEMYLVAMPGVVLDPDDELPPGWGLLLPYGGGLTNLPARGGRRAARRQPAELSRAMALSLLASAFNQAPVTHETAAAQAAAEYQRGYAMGTQRNATEVELARNSAEHQRAIRATFEEASGVRIDQYSAGKVGEAVKLVIDSGRGSDLRSRFWRLYLDALEATQGLARGVAALGGPPTERSYRDGDQQRTLYEALMVAPPEVQP